MASCVSRLCSAWRTAGMSPLVSSPARRSCCHHEHTGLSSPTQEEDWRKCVAAAMAFMMQHIKYRWI